MYNGKHAAINSTDYHLNSVKTSLREKQLVKNSGRLLSPDRISSLMTGNAPYHLLFLAMGIRIFA